MIPGTAARPRASYMIMNRVLSLSLLLAACGPRPGTPAAVPAAGTTSSESQGDPGDAGSAGTRAVRLDPIRIDIVEPGKEGGDARVYDAKSLLEEGNDALMQRKYDEAVASYRHLLADFPDSRLVVAALYNSGLAFEGKRDYGSASERYQQVIEKAPAGSRDMLDARFRLGSVLSEAERYAEAVPVFEAVLASGELGPEDRIEALARLGYNLVELRDYAGAEEILRSALAYHREISASERVEDRHFVAMAQFYLGEIPYRQFASIPLRLPEQQLELDKEQKSELALLARERFIKTVDYKDPFWATAAVYQIGAMYKRFWDDFMAIPIPPELDGAAAKEYVKQVNTHPELQKLLSKALLYHERNVEMARSARVSTIWSEGSHLAAEQIRRILGRQSKQEYVEPGPAIGQVEAPAATPARATDSPTDYVPGRADF